jgi:hypothetical protein
VLVLSSIGFGDDGTADDLDREAKRIIADEVIPAVEILEERLHSKAQSLTPDAQSLTPDAEIPKPEAQSPKPKSPNPKIVDFRSDY